MRTYAISARLRAPSGQAPLEPPKIQRQKGIKEMRICDMAIFHAHFGTVQRSKGQNAIASAAYIGGICLKKLDGEMADYRKKKNVCGHKIIMPTKFAHVKTPSAQWAWNEAENSENRKNSTTARRGDLALPKEFTQDECFEVGYIYAHDIVDKYGVVAQVNFHDLATNNPHIDMQWTTRSFDGQKLGTKTRILDDKKTGPEEIVWMREQWATRVNEVLAKYGKSIDHRSYADQGNEKLATKHLGRKCTALERKGIKTEKANHNDKVRGYNRLIDEKNIVTQEINLLQEQILEDKNEHIQQEKVCRSGRENIPAKDKTCELGGSRRNASSSSWRAGNHENPNPKQ